MDVHSYKVNRHDPAPRLSGPTASGNHTTLGARLLRAAEHRFLSIRHSNAPRDAPLAKTENLLPSTHWAWQPPGHAGSTNQRIARRAQPQSDFWGVALAWAVIRCPRNRAFLTHWFLEYELSVGD